MTPLDDSINSTLISLAYFIVFGGVGVLIIYTRFPQYWQMLFPTNQQKIESQTAIMEADNDRLKSYKESLEAYLTSKSTHADIQKQVRDLEKQVSNKPVSSKPATTIEEDILSLKSKFDSLVEKVKEKTTKK